MVSQAELILRVFTAWFLVLSHFFRDGMGPFKCGNIMKQLVEKNVELSIKKLLGSYYFVLSYFILRCLKDKVHKLQKCNRRATNFL